MSDPCKSSSPPSKKEIKNAIPDILNALGTQACANHSDIQQASMAAAAQGGGFGISVGGSVSGSYAKSKVSSVGCEQVSLAAKQYLAATKKIACILNENVTTTTKQLTARNSIIFRSRNGNVNVGDLKINQSIEIVMLDLTQLSTTAKNSIADEVKQTALQIADTVQESKSGMGATPQGSKSVSDERAEITSENINNVVERVINDISITADADNSILIETVNGDINLKDTDIDQNILINITAELITTSAVDNALQSIATSVSTQESKARQAAENLGADTLGRQAADGVAQIVKEQAAFGGGMWGIIGGIIVLCVGGYLFFKYKGGTEKQQSPTGYPVNQGGFPMAQYQSPPVYQVINQPSPPSQFPTGQWVDQSPPSPLMTGAPIQPPFQNSPFKRVDNGRKDNGLQNTGGISIVGLLVGFCVFVVGCVSAYYYFFMYDEEWMAGLEKADKALDKCLKKIDEACPWPPCTGDNCPTAESKINVSKCIKTQTKKGCPGMKVDKYENPFIKKIASLLAIGAGVVIIIQSLL